MDKYKYINETTDMVGRCTREMVALMKEHNVNVVNFDNLIDAPSATFEEEFVGYYYQAIKSISLDEDDNIIVTAENGLTGYLDGNYGDYFNVADKIGEIYRALVEEIEKEYKILTKEEKAKIFEILNLKHDTPMTPVIADTNDDFVLIYLSFNGVAGLDGFGKNMSVLRNKKTNELFIPTSDAYPITLATANTYVYHSLSDESETKTDIAFTDKFEKITMDKNIKDKLIYLNNCGVSDEEGIIFDGITFVWLKNHTLCVKSAHRPNKSYIAVYKHRKDIVPSKFYEEKPLNFNFPENE